MKPTNPHSEAVARAALPEVMFATDLALAAQMPESEAEEAARQGQFGPWFFIKDRVAVLRIDFIGHLTLCASRNKRICQPK